MASFALTSFIAGPLYDRIGMKVAIAIGTGLIASGQVLLALMIGPDAGVGYLIPGLLIIGTGCGVFYPSMTTAAVDSVGTDRASLAGGIVYMFQIAGGAIGLGLSTTIFTSSSESKLGSDAAAAGVDLTAHQEAVLHGDLAGTDAATAALKELPEGAVETIQRIVSDSFATGVQTSFTVVAAIAVAGCISAVGVLGLTPDPDQ